MHISRYMPEKRKAAARAFRVCKRAALPYMNGLVRAMWASVGLVLCVRAQGCNTSQFSDCYTIAVCVSSCYTHRFSECCVCQSMLCLPLSSLCWHTHTAYVSIRQHTCLWVHAMSSVCWRMLTQTHSIRQHTLAYVSVSPCYVFRWALEEQKHQVCWRMLTYTDVCWRMLMYADVCCV